MSPMQFEQPDRRALTGEPVPGTRPIVRMDVSAAVQNHGGLGRYAGELAGALCRAGEEELRVFYNDTHRRSPAPPLDAMPRKTLAWSNKPWKMAALVSVLVRVPMDSVVGEADVFHATDHLLPYLGAMRSVFTLHDVAFLRCPETHLPSNRWFLRLAMPRFLRRADAIIAVSEYTRNDAVHFYGVAEDKIHVIPEGVNVRFRPVEDARRLDEVRRRYQLPEKFVLCVSTIEPRKNLVTLWEAYGALRSEGRAEKLVVVGRTGWLVEKTFARLRELGLEGDVVFPGSVLDEDLPVLYSLAQCFAFPSRFEGFGLPPLEAMACGCPVVCSDSSSLPEVCGDAAMLFPPRDTGALAEALRAVLDDGALRDRLRDAGLRQASRFSWDIAARRTSEVYRAVLARNRGKARGVRG